MTRPATCSGCNQPAEPELGPNVLCRCRIPYDPKCAACWLGFGHNLDRHNESLSTTR